MDPDHEPDSWTLDIHPNRGPDSRNLKIKELFQIGLVHHPHMVGGPSRLVDLNRGPNSFTLRIHLTHSSNWLSLLVDPTCGALKTRSCSGLDLWILHAWEMSYYSWTQLVEHKCRLISWLILAIRPPLHFLHKTFPGTNGKISHCAKFHSYSCLIY